MHPTGLLYCKKYIQFSVPSGLIFQYVPIIFSTDFQNGSGNAMGKITKRMEHSDCFTK